MTALTELRKMIDHHDSQCMMFAVNPMCHPLHHHPGFIQLLARVDPASDPAGPQVSRAAEAYEAVGQ
jgi:hypothetical protein